MLARFERLMEQAIEGSLRRVFPTSLQPIQLAKAAARAMEQAQIIGVRGAEVPNLYELHLAAADVERFGEYRETLANEVCTYLHEYAEERRLRPVAELRVELIEDPRLRTGEVRAIAQFAGLPPTTQHEVDEAVASTRKLRLADLAAAQTTRPKSARAKLRLSDGAGLDFALEPSNEVVRLGRATDNDVVVESQRVSRYHSQLRWVESDWLVYDLDSTNGTWLDDKRIESGLPLLLRASSRLRLGDYELKVVSNAAKRGPR